MKNLDSLEPVPTSAFIRSQGHGVAHVPGFDVPPVGLEEPKLSSRYGEWKRRQLGRKNLPIKAARARRLAQQFFEIVEGDGDLSLEQRTLGPPSRRSDLVIAVRNVGGKPAFEEFGELQPRCLRDRRLHKHPFFRDRIAIATFAKSWPGSSPSQRSERDD